MAGCPTCGRTDLDEAGRCRSCSQASISLDNFWKGQEERTISPVALTLTGSSIPGADLDDLPVASDSPLPISAPSPPPESWGRPRGPVLLPASKTERSALPAAAGDAEDEGHPEDAEELPEELPVGQVVADRYCICRWIGKGGMGQVYEAEQLDLERRVALKMLHPQLATSQRHKERFWREARTASRLHHPGSVVIHDYGEWRGRIFIVMEYLAGFTLDDLLERRGRLPPRQALEITLQVVDVLEAAHREGILHRDLKPGNIILLPDENGAGRVKLVDFGLAFLLDRDQDIRLTKEGMLVGTPAYMPPERLQGKEFDPRSDLYAVGVLLYEMICGRLPFTGATAEYMVQTLYLDPLPPSQLGVELPHRLEQIILRLLAKQPIDRPASAAELGQALRGIIPGDDDSGQRSRNVILGDRQARVRAAGLGPSTLEEGSGFTSGGAVPVLVVEQATDFSTSLTALLRAQGFIATTSPALPMPRAGRGNAMPAPVVIDLRPDPELIFAQLAARLTQGRLDGRPVVLVGPDGTMDLMTRALELAVAEYVPEAVVTSKLARALIRLSRKRR